MQPIKKCRACGEFKPITKEYFRFVNSKARGLIINARCNPCARIRDVEYKRKERSLHPERNAEICKRWSSKNKNRLREYSKSWYDKNAEIQRAKKRVWNRECAEEHRKRVSEWREKNPEVAKETALRAYKKRRLNPNVRINDSVRGQISKMLKGIGVNKNGKTTRTILGYSAETLKKHLEKQFIKGMNWKNYGTWHIDHIIPIKSFNFSSVDDPEFKAAWALTNLRPLWGSENMSKSASRTYLL